MLVRDSAKDVPLRPKYKSTDFAYALKSFKLFITIAACYYCNSGFKQNRYCLECYRGACDAATSWNCFGRCTNKPRKEYSRLIGYLERDYLIYWSNYLHSYEPNIRLARRSCICIRSFNLFTRAFQSSFMHCHKIIPFFSYSVNLVIWSLHLKSNLLDWKEAKCEHFKCFKPVYKCASDPFHFSNLSILRFRSNSPNKSCLITD